MNLNLTWTAPSPRPTCGFKAEYRRKADSSYNELVTSGTTATIVVNAPTCYEGVVISDCCSGSTATGAPFGINAYSTFSITGTLNNLREVAITVTSLYPNPYLLKITGTYVITFHGAPGTHSFTFNYPANSTSYTDIVSGGYAQGVSLSDLTITQYIPEFDNKGALQILDPILTPSYFKFYFGGDAEPVWNGAPISLPSFTIDAFNPTEIDVDGTTVLAGNLLVSYILSYFYMTSFTSVELEVYDDITLIGSVILSTGPLGARNAIIPLVKGSNPLDSGTLFTMKAVWPDTTIIDTERFSLPLP